MSVDRIAALEARIASLEQRPAATLGLAALSLALGISLAGSGVGAQGAAQTMTARAPFKVVNASGAEIFSIEDAVGTVRMNLLSNNKTRASLSASAEGSVLYLDGSQSFTRLATDFGGADTGPSFVMTDKGNNLLNIQTDGVAIEAPLTVMPKDDLVMFKVESQSVTATDRLEVRAAKGANRTSMRPTSLQVIGGDGATAAATLGLDDVGKGRLVVGQAAGTRAVIGQPKAGGVSFALYPGAGPDYGIGMLADGTSGLRLNSGKRQIELEVQASYGNVSLFNDAGTSVASLDSTTGGFGRLDLSNSAGDLVVQAGTTTDGLGVVRAGPIMGGPIGNTGLVPFAIMGRKSK